MTGEDLSDIQVIRYYCGSIVVQKTEQTEFARAEHSFEHLSWFSN